MEQDRPGKAREPAREWDEVKVKAAVAAEGAKAVAAVAVWDRVLVVEWAREAVKVPAKVRVVAREWARAEVWAKAEAVGRGREEPVSARLAVKHFLTNEESLAINSSAQNAVPQ